MGKWWQIGAAAALCGLLAACGGGGGAGGDPDDGSTLPARAGEVQIGPAGGTVDAVLEGGTTLRIDIPADALKASATLRIEPVPAQAGDLGGFRITPADLALAKPVALTLTWSARQDAPADVVLAVRRGDALLPISPVLRGQELRFELSSLGALPPGLAEAGAAARSPREKPQASHGNARASADADPPDETLRLVALPEAERLAALRSAVDLARNGQGSSAFAMSVQRSFDAVVGSTNPASPTLRAIALDWKPFVCAQRTSADSALNTYEGSAGVVFEQRAGASLRWGLVARDMGRALGLLVPAIAPCADAPEDFRQPVLDKLPAFLERVEVAVHDVPFNQLIDDELPPLINVEVMLRNVDADGLVLPTLQWLATRLRDMAHESCRIGAGQDDHAKLLARTVGDAGFAAIASYDEAAVRDDIQRCGLRFVVESLASDDRAVDNIHNLGATNRETELAMVGAARLAISRGAQRLFALQCPSNVSANNEQLVVEAGPAPGNMTELTRISSSNASTYLESTPELSFSREALHALRDPATDVTLLRIRRDGGLCSGAFANLTEHVVLVQLRLDFRDDISGTWVGTITFSAARLDVVSQEQPGLHGWLGSSWNESYSLQGAYQVSVQIVAGRASRITVLAASGNLAFNALRRGRIEEIRGVLPGCVYFEAFEETESGNLALAANGAGGSLQVRPDGQYSLVFGSSGGGIPTQWERVSSRGTFGTTPPCTGDFVDEQRETRQGSQSRGLPSLESSGTVDAGVIRGSATQSVPGPGVGVTYTWNASWQLQRQ